MSINVWQKQGVVIPAVSSDTPGQPNVLYESGAVILSGTVFKMWFGTKNGVCYAESTDGISWTRYGSNPIIPIASLGTNPFSQSYPRLYKEGSTYYVFANNGDSAVQCWTSTDGVTFSQANANSLAAYTQAWESGGWFGQLSILGKVGGTYYGYYQAYNSGVSPQRYQNGLATASSLTGTWTKSASNPYDFSCNPCFQQVGGTWYMWGQIVQSGIPNYGSLSLPNDIGRLSSSSPSGPWTLLSTPTLYRTRSEEGVGTTVGQVADPTMVAANGNIYCYYSALAVGTGAAGQQIGCAIANSTTFAQLVSSYEGVSDVPITSNAGLALNLNALGSDNFTRADANPIGGNWTQQFTGAGFTTAQLASNLFESSAVSDNSDSYWNAVAWSTYPDQFAQLTLHALADSNSWMAMNVRGTVGAWSSATTYRLSVHGPIGASSAYQLYKYVGGTWTTLIPITTLPTSVSDVFTLAVAGSTISVYQNGNLLTVFTDSSVASGSAGVGATANASAVTSAQLSAAAFGNLISSPTLAPPATTQTTGQPTPVTAANASGHALSITSPTTASHYIQPAAVVFCDANGNELSVTGATVGSEIAAPIPVVLCDAAGHPITSAVTITSNGNSITVTTSLTGTHLGNPTPVCLTDPNGNDLSQNYSYGALTQNPYPAVLCDVNGNPITITLS